MTSKVSCVLVVTGPIISVINHFQCQKDLYTSNIQLIETLCIHLVTLFVTIFGNFEIDSNPSDQFQESFLWDWVGGTMRCVCLGHNNVIRLPCMKVTFRFIKLAGKEFKITLGYNLTVLSSIDHDPYLESNLLSKIKNISS